METYGAITQNERDLVELCLKMYTQPLGVPEDEEVAEIERLTKGIENAAARVAKERERRAELKTLANLVGVPN